ncbi:MAG: helix-turn-helix domain-containing protein [Myxococcota bacterium]|jgi:MinD-like ATPase involved in chromosome partitioning or flagellar assembly|nr:helix-turn-helix domain-containing protein [Myxococcota bacterium]
MSVREKPKIIALTAGKGGVGRSTLIIELAQALARHEQRVLLVDLDPASHALTSLLEMHPIDIDEQEGIVHTRNERVDLYLSDALLSGSRSPSELAQLLRDFEYHWILADLPTGTSPNTLHFARLAELQVLASLPEPNALASAAQFLRGIILAELAQHSSKEAVAELQRLAAAHPRTWTFVHLFRDASTDGAREALVEVCQKIHIGLLINQVREGSDHTQAEALCHAWGIEFGVWLRYMGGVVYDERRWFFARRLAPPSQVPLDESVAGDIERLARSLLEFDWKAWASPRPCLPCVDPDNYPRVFLDMTGGTASEVRQVYRKLWESYRRENGIISFVLDPAGRRRALKLLDAAYRKASMEDPAHSSPAIPLFERNTPGERLRDARIDKGMGLRELSLRTRVGVKEIEAIEEQRAAELPNRSYLRAYLLELAKALELDPEKTVEEYINALESAG